MLSPDTLTLGAPAPPERGDIMKSSATQSISFSSSKKFPKTNKSIEIQIPIVYKLI